LAGPPPLYTIFIPLLMCSGIALAVLAAVPLRLPLPGPFAPLALIPWPRICAQCKHRNRQHGSSPSNSLTDLGTGHGWPPSY
jgi:hypothetical protein